MTSRQESEPKNGDILHFLARGQGSERTLPEERSPVETRLRRKGDTDQIRRGEQRDREPFLIARHDEMPALPVSRRESRLTDCS